MKILILPLAFVCFITSLSCASMKKQELSIKLGREINDPESVGKRVEHLLKAGADPNFKREKPFPLIFDVIRDANIKNVELLLRYGADVNANVKGLTPLIFAAIAHHYAHPDVFLYNKAGWDKYRSFQKQLIALLIKYGATIDALSKETYSALLTVKGCNVLDYVTALGDKELLVYLKNNGAQNSNTCKISKISNPD